MFKGHFSQCARNVSVQKHEITSTNRYIGHADERRVVKKTVFFLDAYQRACSKQYGYLYIDINPRNPEKYQLRTDILPHQITKVFLPTGGA